MSSREEREWWPRTKARAIIKDLKISQPSDISIEDIAWNQGAWVIDGGVSGCDARLVHTPGAGMARLRVRKNLSPPGKRRFAIAHELGHLALKHDPGQPAECSDKEFLRWYKGQSDKEAQANVFAAELIMPEELFAPRATGTVPSFDLIESLASEFQTTLTATAIRYVQLCGHKCAIVCSADSRVAWSWPSPEFHYWIKQDTELRAHSYAIDFFHKGPDAAEMREMQEVPRNAWIDGESMQDSIREQSRSLFSYCSVLTLLWIYD
jgi:hypothetical protein